MKRRDFLKMAMQGAAVAGGATALNWPLNAFGAANVPMPRTLVRVLLNGGIDWRFALVPAPDYDDNYVTKFWSGRRGIYSGDYAHDVSGYADLFEQSYQRAMLGGIPQPFGFHNSCGWLARKFAEGKVAIIANTFGSTNRDHDHSVHIMNVGDRGVGATEKTREGWGGRMVETRGGDTNVVSVWQNVSPVSYGTDLNNRLARVVHAKNMRDMALAPHVSTVGNAKQHVDRRALRAYYQQRTLEVKTEKDRDWIYHKFFQHYDSITAYGGAIKSRLDLPGNALPGALTSLALADTQFAVQCKNLYDCCQTGDYLNPSLIEMYYTGFDTHSGEENTLKTQLQDIFGNGGTGITGGGLDIAMTQIAAQMSHASSNLVFMFASDFGRQLMANDTNGNAGTDHGSGTYTILIGDQVNGGIYGDMFPLREADGSGSPLETHGADILGLTSFEHIYAQACDWAVGPGFGSLVFPYATPDTIERDAAGDPVFSNLFVG